MGGDIFGVLLTFLLLGANAFFVASEFSLISARRDRLEALAEQGKKSAVTVIRAGENLSLMLAGAQLGITICSILLGRVGEPAVAHLLGKPFELFGIPDSVLHTVSFFVALAVVVTLHVLLGEMVPKNIAIAGPESSAMLLIPTYLVWIRLARPFIAFYNWCANITLRTFGVVPKDELDVAVSTVELSEMIAESLSEGLLDPGGARPAHPRPADPKPRRQRRRCTAERDTRRPGGARGIRAHPGGDRRGARRNRLLAFPGQQRLRRLRRIPAHQGCAAARA